MLGHRELTMEDYVDIFKRRFWILLTCAVVLGAAGATLRLCPSSPLCLADACPDRAAEGSRRLCKARGQEDLGARLASMKEQILSRSRIQPIIERFNLFAGRKYHMESAWN